MRSYCPGAAKYSFNPRAALCTVIGLITINYIKK